MARGWHYAKLSLSNAPRLSFSGLCILLFLFLSLCRSLCVCVFLLLSLELGRCSSDLFLSSRPRTGLATTCILKKDQNAPRPSEHPTVMGKKMAKRLGGIKGCKYKTSSWHLNRFPDADNIGSTV